MRLADLVESENIRFLQEDVIDGLWPFNRLPFPRNLVALSFVYLWSAMFLLLLFGMSFEAFALGCIVGCGIVVWTYGIIRFGDTIRSVEITRTSGMKLRVARVFVQDIFQNGSVIIGILSFVGVLVYFLTLEKEPFARFVGSPYNPLILFYFLLLLFDVCYRFGLTGYISVVIFRRNLLLSRLINDDRLRDQIQPGDVGEYKQIDKHVYTMIAGSFFLIPISFLIHWHLLMLVVILILFMSGAVTLSLLHLETLRVKAFPEEVVRVLSIERFGYVGSIRPQGFPHITPSVFVFDGKRIYLATSLKSQKIRNLTISPFVSFFVRAKAEFEEDHTVFGFLGVQVNGKAKILGRTPFHAILIVFLHGFRMWLVQRLMKRKYTHYLRSYSKYGHAIPKAWRIIPFLYRVLIEITPETFIISRRMRERSYLV
ncbi:MAG: pyridoxamine 5'-phosphate oxidase family protein [Candidatus Hodarchaeales archaeon]|jgi:hypothetical protein